MSRLIGIAVCGGQSSRMGVDKSMLVYYDKPQRYHVYDLLSAVCDEVFISCNNKQAETIPDNYSVLIDAPAYHSIGPIAALLTAYERFPNDDILLLGCDYPIINKLHLRELIEAKLQTIKSASYYHESEDKYEPLIAVYQSIDILYAKNSFKLSELSLQRLLSIINAGKISPNDDSDITSVDNYEEYQRIHDIIQHRT